MVVVPDAAAVPAGLPATGCHQPVSVHRLADESARNIRKMLLDSLDKMVENLIKSWFNIPANAHEPIICKHFVELLLSEIGFGSSEWYPQFPAGKGKVDYAAGKNTDGNIFIKNPKNPYLLIEVKGRQTAAGAVINLAEGTPQYKKTREQIVRYLLSPNCQSTRWGLITNGSHIQLFGRHGKVVFPTTANRIIKPDNISQIVEEIKTLINGPNKALSICVYNDKGGVGKTTTVANLAAVLGVFKKKVLVVDFDPQQGDLTSSLGKTEGQTKLSQCLIDKKYNIGNTIQEFKLFFNKTKKEMHFFDIIAADSELAKIIEPEKMALVLGSFERLKKSMVPLLNNYDYIIFDCPTNWGFFTKSCIWASDVVLIPTQHDNFASLKNAKKVIEEYLPEIQEKTKDGGPIALPIFFNNHRPTVASIPRANQEIDSLLKIGEKNGKPILNTDLLSLFYPKYTKGNPDKSIFSIPQYAIIASAGFSRRPAALTHKNACQYYADLVKEYFLE